MINRCPILVVLIFISFIVKIVFLVLQKRKLQENKNKGINKPEYIYRAIPIIIDFFPLLSVGTLVKNLTLGLPTREDNPNIFETRTFWITFVLISVCIFIQIISRQLTRKYCRGLSVDEKILHNIFSFIAVAINAYFVFYMLWSLEKNTWIDFIFIGSNPLDVKVDNDFYEICMYDSTSMILDSLVEPYCSMYLFPEFISNMIYVLYYSAAFCAGIITLTFAIADKKHKPSSIVISKIFWQIILLIGTSVIIQVKMFPAICLYILISLWVLILLNSDIDTAYENNVMGINGVFDDTIQREKDNVTLRKVYSDLPSIDKLKICYFPKVFVVNVVFILIRIGLFLLFRL